MKLIIFSFFATLFVNLNLHARSLKILTYNVWMVDAPFKLGSRDIEARAAAMPKVMSDTGADVIALQEVWPDKYKEKLSDDFRKLGYAYTYYQNASYNFLLRGLFGNGLLVVSKLPLQVSKVENESVLAYTEFTRPDEYFVGKGVLHVRVQLAENQYLSLYDTHLGAVSFDPLTKTYSPSHEADRKKQQIELFTFIQQTKAQDLVVLTGDFNSNTASAQIPSDFVDSFKLINGENSQKFSVDGDLNPYTDTSPVYRYRSPKRMLDYIYIEKNKVIKIVNSQLAMTESIEIPDRDEKKPLSDHFAILTEIEIF